VEYFDPFGTQDPNKDQDRPDFSNLPGIDFPAPQEQQASVFEQQNPAFDFQYDLNYGVPSQPSAPFSPVTEQGQLAYDQPSLEQQQSPTFDPVLETATQLASTPPSFAPSSMTEQMAGKSDRESLWDQPSSLNTAVSPNTPLEPLSQEARDALVGASMVASTAANPPASLAGPTQPSSPNIDQLSPYDVTQTPSAVFFDPTSLTTLTGPSQPSQPLSPTQVAGQPEREEQPPIELPTIDVSTHMTPSQVADRGQEMQEREIAREQLEQGSSPDFGAFGGGGGDSRPRTSLASASSPLLADEPAPSAPTSAPPVINQPQPPQWSPAMNPLAPPAFAAGADPMAAGVIPYGSYQPTRNDRPPQSPDYAGMDAQRDAVVRAILAQQRGYA